MIESKIYLSKDMDDKMREAYFKEQEQYYKDMMYLITHFVKKPIKK